VKPWVGACGGETGGGETMGAGDFGPTTTTLISRARAALCWPLAWPWASSNWGGKWTRACAVQDGLHGSSWPGPLTLLKNPSIFQMI
jgi:hypothetical protein